MSTTQGVLIIASIALCSVGVYGAVVLAEVRRRAAFERHVRQMEAMLEDEQ